MMGKIVTLLAFTAIFLILGYFLYETIPGNPISLIQIPSGIKNDGIKQDIDYGNTPVFMENLRFNKNVISYYIEETCDEKRKSRMIEALNIYQNEMKIISFYNTNFQEADILVGCSNDYIDMGENLFAAGEGGPSQIINTSNFKIIQNGKISLYKKSECKYPIVEIHELSHVFGFDHSENPKSIMYMVADCEQRITPDMKELMKELYTIEPKPDLEIEKLNGTVRGRYLDFSITVTNTGILDSEKVWLTIYADEKEVEKVDLQEVGVGYGRVLTAENIKMPVRNPKSIKFYVDAEENIDELNEDNNYLSLTENQ